jgi:hypothetical protein
MLSNPFFHAGFALVRQPIVMAYPSTASMRWRQARPVM